MIKTAIMGASSPVAGELLRILINHPDVRLMWVNSRSMASGAVADIHAGLHGDVDLRFTPEVQLEGIDMLFLCSTPGETRDFLDQHPDLPPAMRIIDLSGACIGRDDFIYGLPELERKAMVRGGTRVAVPAAVTTVLNLALLPLAKNLMINNPVQATVITAQSDQAASTVLGSSDNIALDRPLRHPAAAEVVEILSRLQCSLNQPVKLISMRGPQQRGTFATLLVETNTDLPHLRQLYEQYYDDHNFVWLTERAAELKDVVNTNKCLLHLQRIDGQLLITAVLDNHLKGAAGTAVHAMNLLFGLSERTGLALKTSTYN